MKPTFQIKKNENDVYSLKIEGDLTIQSSTQFKSQLIDLLDSCTDGNIEICVRSVTALDTSAIQLIYAAGKALSLKNISLFVRWPENEKVEALITRTGFKQLLIF